MSSPKTPITTDALVAELEQVVQVGLRAALDLDLGALDELSAATIAAPDEDRLRGVIAGAVERMGLTPFAAAARDLFGLSDGLADAKLGVRQEHAAQRIPISARQFRRPGAQQDRVIMAAAESLLRGGVPLSPRSIPSLHQLEHQVHVREVVESDHDFVIELMDVALAPYYGGDHRAHGERLLRTHREGGLDRLGFFSLEQRMFMATLGTEMDSPRLGFVHLVGKRQGTYKISPLIVAPEVRGRLHVGPTLLRFAEAYARDRDARTLYCTVSQSNIQALRFFVQNGFIRAGRSASHYKPDATEIMLYKLLSAPDAVAAFDAPNISVMPMTSAHEEQVRELLLRHLPGSFIGIDNSWVDALFAGYERRDTPDVNRKFKLIFVASDRAGTVLGVAGATPKKGEPIKVMPLLAVTVPAFSALITDIPYALKPYGRKLYAHLTPGPDETIALQRRGWQLDAALPAAYHTEQVTQQWSLDIDSEDFMRTMRVKQRYLDFIKAGTKPLEVRVGYDSIKTIRAGERVRFASRDETQIVLVRDVRRYRTFEEMAERENLSHVVPGQPRKEVMRILKEIYPPDRERLGVVVLDIEPMVQG